MHDTKPGSRVLAARKARKMTQQAFAEACGVSITTVSRWENRRLGMSLQHADTVSRVLGVSRDWLAYGEGSMDGAAA